MDVVEKMARAAAAAEYDSIYSACWGEHFRDTWICANEQKHYRFVKAALAVLPDHIRKQIEGEWGKLPATCPACKEPLICRECDINLTIEALDMVQIEGAE